MNQFIYKISPFSSYNHTNNCESFDNLTLEIRVLNFYSRIRNAQLCQMKSMIKHEANSQSTESLKSSKCNYRVEHTNEVKNIRMITEINYVIYVLFHHMNR